MGGNLPPGVTTSDIDDAYGVGHSDIVHADVTIAVGIEVPEHVDQDDVIERLKQAARDGEWDEIVETEIHDRYRK